MTAYSTSHGGFVIPNAGSAIVNNMAEPDAVDFNTIGNARWGVVSGCEVSGTDNGVDVNSGIAVVNGQIVVVPSSPTLSLSSSTSPRFDAVCIDAGGHPTLITGLAGSNPVYPDIPVNYTLIAVVYNESTITNFEDYVIDKRNMLAPVFATAAAADTTIIRNIDSGVDTFRVNADGRIEWHNNDAALYRAAAGNIRIKSTLSVDDDLTVGSDITAGQTISATGTTTGSNLRVGTSSPGSTAAANGSIFQTSFGDGTAYLRRNGVWEEIATIESAIPVGTIIQSMDSTLGAPGTGWLRLDGHSNTAITEGGDYDSLFGLDGLAAFISGTAPNRSLTVPDATGRFLIGGPHAYGSPLGGATNGAVTIGTTNLPAHTHSVTLGSNGPHSHDVTVASAGIHNHSINTGTGTHYHLINDPGHTHVPDGSDSAYKFAVDSSQNKAAKAGAAGRLDSVHVDGSHANWVRMQGATASSKTGITTTTSETSGHSHPVNNAGAHTHTASIASSTGTHDHQLTEQSVGGGTALNILPPYLTVYTYIRY